MDDMGLDCRLGRRGTGCLLDMDYHVDDMGPDYRLCRRAIGRLLNMDSSASDPKWEHPSGLLDNKDSLASDPEWEHPSGFLDMGSLATGKDHPSGLLCMDSLPTHSKGEHPPHLHLATTQECHHARHHTRDVRPDYATCVRGAFGGERLHSVDSFASDPKGFQAPTHACHHAQDLGPDCGQGALGGGEQSW